MSVIRLLPDSVVNKIAAGEVVERPASVVRELVDNSIDSGASFIRVELSAGGKSVIKVSDNGSGMTRDDALLAIERHATSKISQFEDLNSISSRGFRGEALASIAAVSKFSLRTRRADDAVGTEVSLHGGAVQSVREIPLQVGTEIEVRSLFYNVPARKKFLRSDAVEQERTLHWLRKTFLNHPEIHIPSPE